MGAGTPPTDTCAPVVNPEPAIVMTAPPSAVPESGDTPSTCSGITSVTVRHRENSEWIGVAVTRQPSSSATESATLKAPFASVCPVVEWMGVSPSPYPESSQVELEKNWVNTSTPEAPSKTPTTEVASPDATAA